MSQAAKWQGGLRTGLNAALPKGTLKAAAGVFNESGTSFLTASVSHCHTPGRKMKF